MNILSTNQTQALIGRLNIPKLNTSVKGEDHYRAKLSAKDVIEIRQLVEKRTELMNQARELTNQKLADKYGVSKTCIESVSCGRTWKSA